MFGIGTPELIVIFIIALLVVGPKRLPELARTIGKGLAEFRRVTEDATESLKETLRAEDLKHEFEDVVKDFEEEINEKEKVDPFSQPHKVGDKEPPPPNA